MFKKNDKVKVISGKNAGAVGVVLGRSVRDGYRIRSNKGKVIYVKSYYVIEYPMDERTEIREGDVVVVMEPNAAHYSTPGRDQFECLCKNKNAMVSLIYTDEEYGEVANIVYQGQYAIIPLSALRRNPTRIAGKHITV
ncbi:MotB-like transcriptional regulator [Citrobacter phage Moon]|uniref:KOW domain-containing protein n=1 Tax=Citrobacter phage Moon TaxID=1540095 RepID=A0A0A0YV71_9CAUD|nr:MotB-like transcriptional regulator [Citrobacter phage Moon]AIX11985.1 hypothetical protein CPT_Moon14 [Citrobacter phage Moon]